MTLNDSMNLKRNGIRHRNICLSTAFVWVVGSLSQSTFPQLACAFTTPPTTFSPSNQCRNRIGERVLSLYHHGASSPLSPSSSPSTPIPSSVFDANQPQIQFSFDDVETDHESELMDALAGSTTPLQHDAMEAGRGQKQIDDKREFELGLGKAMDTLRKDYPDMLKVLPDFSIYHDDIEVVDPSGFKLHNLNRYKASFRFLHGMLNFFYDSNLSMLTFKIIYDCARKDIRVSWNAYLVPRAIYGGEGNALYLDGISVYVLDKLNGIITEHRVEHLLLNDVPVQAPEGIFEAMRSAVGAKEGPEGVPVWNMELDMDAKFGPIPGQFNFEFRRHAGLLAGVQSSSSLFSAEENTSSSSSTSDNSNTSPTTTTLFSSESSDANKESSEASNLENHLASPFFNEIEFERKNTYRRKYGLKPITPDEYIKIEVEVEALASVQREKESAAMAAAELAKPKPKNKFFGNLFGGILQDTCESNWDCQRPEVCCDLLVKKMCCSSGTKVPVTPQMQMMPIKIPMDDPGSELPRGGPNGNLY
eukprot:CAMPEP_0198259712 /NCGR_PEP_ID=MMETSP1447-20131203/8827_1 /TAXON_ID=420782 /ORGANISM="Chaetoceros dichaeta, Strain CCMP1751" /LENGTH=531 /DNA_ID=CAMNT_0043947163 /DNA_START=72 /DNA_END=1667 /DNA_ORIENTATION=+